MGYHRSSPPALTGVSFTTLGVPRDPRQLPPELETAISYGGFWMSFTFHTRMWHISLPVERRKELWRPHGRWNTCRQAEGDGWVLSAAQGSQPALGSCLHGRGPYAALSVPCSGGHHALAGTGCDSTGPFHLSQISCPFFSLFNPLASLTLFYNPVLGSLKSTLVIKHVGACE